MTPTRARADRLILETLDSVVAPSVRDALLTLALEGASLAEVPTAGVELQRFVEGPLRTAMVQGLGTELADSVVEEITRVAQLYQPQPASVERRVSRPGMKRSLSPPPRRNTPTHRAALRQTPPTVAPPPSEPTREEQDRIPTLAPPPMSGQPMMRGLTPPPPSGPVSRPGVPWGSNEYPSGTASLGLSGAAPSMRPYVLVASDDERLVDQLGPWLDQRAEIAKVGSVRELVADLELMGEAKIALVVDCRRPSIRPIAVAALAEELPESVSVVLWAPSAEQERALRAVSEDVARWHVVRAEAKPLELAERCATLVG